MLIVEYDDLPDFALMDPLMSLSPCTLCIFNLRI